MVYRLGLWDGKPKKKVVQDNTASTQPAASVVPGNTANTQHAVELEQVAEIVQPSFFQRHWGKIAIGLGVLTMLGVAAILFCVPGILTTVTVMSTSASVYFGLSVVVPASTTTFSVGVLATAIAATIGFLVGIVTAGVGYFGISSCCLPREEHEDEMSTVPPTGSRQGSLSTVPSQDSRASHVSLDAAPPPSDRTTMATSPIVSPLRSPVTPEKDEPSSALSL